MTTWRIPLLLLFSATLCMNALSQEDSPVITQLKDELSSSNTTIEQVDIYNKIAFQLLFIDTALCMTYIDTAASMSKDDGYKQGLARALNIVSLHHIFQNRHDKGIAINKEALGYCDDEDHFVKGKIYNAIGMAYQKMYVVDKCLENYQQALYHATENNDTMTTAVVLGNIANIHSTQNNLEDAKYYFLQLEELSSSHQDQNVQFAFYIRYAEFLTKTNDFEESLKYLDKALISAEDLKHNSKIRKVRLQMAINNISSGKYEIAEICLDSMMSNAIEPTDHTRVRYHYWKANLEYLKENPRIAFQNAQVGLDIINESNDFYFYKPKLLTLLHNIEGQNYNYKEAYAYLLELNDWQDSIGLKERENKILELETKYQSEKREIENTLLKVQSESKSVKLKQRTQLAIASIMAMLLSLVLLYILFRNSRKDKRNNELLESKVHERTLKLKKSNEELERFSYIASHDLKEPIRNIKAFTNLLKKKINSENSSPEVVKYLNIVDMSSDQMEFLVNGILDYTKLGDHKNKEMVDLNEVVENVTVYLQNLISERQSKVIYDKLPTIECNPIQVFQVFKNLIENGIKYNESDVPMVEINCNQQENLTAIKFKDNGIGIDSKHKDEVFEMFSRLHNRKQYTGSGLGLSIVKKVSALMGGQIALEKSDSTGSIFTLSLPK